ncbi:rab11 family-interacting protein 1 isoform X2 [Folsomia candida]|uniref:rab11 family-interacting protein 1 isoform X2 n=1 Tax=Folsomia candida TaxID=158441 RepID=UPI000B905B6A|nr:rab11 family-interacting protein 1 isoform X2 [Folsomia candida]
MWTPTHVQVTVQRARGLLQKGKNGTNDAFVTIALGKEKFQTSVKDKAEDPVEWHEECELQIPRQGNKADIVLTVLHRNFIGDEFLGQISIPLAEFDVYDKPKNKWYELKSKPGQEKKNKYRGEIEVKVQFTVQSGVNTAASLADINKKDGIRASLGTLSQKMGGSLLSLGKEKKGSLRNLAKAVGHKVSTLPGRGKKKNKDESFGAIPESTGISGSEFVTVKRSNRHDADPGVISDDEDEFRFDELSHRSSHSSLSVSQVALSTPKDGSLENLGGGEFMRRSHATPPPVKQPPPKVETKGFPEPVTKPHRWSSGAADDWESKLFGKKEIKTDFEADIYVPQVIHEKPIFEKVEDNPNSEISVKPKHVTPPTPVVQQQEREPVPKPRQVQNAPKLEEPPPPAPKINTIQPNVAVVETQSSPNTKPKESIRNSVKESLASIFGGSNNKHETQKGTPIAVTNPIRNMKDHHEARLPRDILKKYENKSREDLIEIIINQQASVEYQKQKLSDMEDYIDNLVARVIETHPTLLQSPFVTRHTLK